MAQFLPFFQLIFVGSFLKNFTSFNARTMMATENVYALQMKKSQAWHIFGTAYGKKKSHCFLGKKYKNKKKVSSDENVEFFLWMCVHLMFVAGIRWWQFWEKKKWKLAPDVKMENVNCELCEFVYDRQNRVRTMKARTDNNDKFIFSRARLNDAVSIKQMRIRFFFK